MSNKQTKIAAVASVLVLALLFVSVYLLRKGSGGSASTNLPPNFLISRQEASVISQNIVDLTNKTDAKIAEANAADLAGDKVKAKALVEDAQNINKDAYQAASDLAAQLKILTESLATMNPSSQRLAYEAVATEFSLVSEFIVYTQNLNGFLEKLLVSMETDVQVSKEDIANALQNTNDSAKKINSLNTEFNARMKALDNSF